MMASCCRRSTSLHYRGSCGRLFCNAIQFLAIASVLHICHALTGPTITLGSQNKGTTTSATVSFTPAAALHSVYYHAISITLSGSPTLSSVSSYCSLVTPTSTFNTAYSCSASISAQDPQVLKIQLGGSTNAIYSANQMITLIVHGFILPAAAQPAMTAVAAEISGGSAPNFSPESSTTGTFPAIYTPGNWLLDSNNQYIWTSAVPNFQSAVPLIMDVTARIIVAPVTSLSIQNNITFAAGESIMLPLCIPASPASATSQDSKITFESSSTITVSVSNTTGNHTFAIPTQMIGSNARVLNGHLNVLFPTDVYATGLIIVFAVTKMKFASDIVCNTISPTSGTAFRTGKSTSEYLNNMNSYPLIMNSISFLKATLSDSRPSRPTKIRLRAQNSFFEGSSLSCTNQAASIQLPFYFGNQVNVSALTVNVFGSPSDVSSGGSKAIQAKITNLAFNPMTFTLTGTITHSAAFGQCGQFYLNGDFFVDILGLSSPHIVSDHSLLLTMSMSYITRPVLYPAIESISNAKISFGSATAAGVAQFIVSFATSFDVVDICGPGDSANMKQRIVIRIHDAAQMTQMCSSAAQATARFLSVPRNSPVRIGKVALSLVSGTCEISLYLSSGDTVNSCVTPKILPAPEIPSAPIQLAIDGLKLPDSQQPPMAVSIVIDEASPKGVTQSCNKCAEWPATPVFSGSIVFEGSDSYYSHRFRSLVVTLNDIGGIVALDTLTIQIPSGISYYYYSGSGSSIFPVVCTGPASTEKFDVKSYYPYLVLQWKTGNAALSSASIKITCTWITESGGSQAYWLSSFDSDATNDLLIKKESGSGVRQIRNGYSPARYLQPSVSGTLRDRRPGTTTTFSIQATRGSFQTTVLIPALGFSLVPASIGAAATALCSCQPRTSGAVSNALQTCSAAGKDQTAEVEVAGEFLKISGFLNVRFNYCYMTVRNPNTVGPQSSSVAYIDNFADRSYSAPIVSGISSVSVELSEHFLDTTIRATITFAHNTPLSSPSEVRLSGFCNFGKQGGLLVTFPMGGIQATASFSSNGCDLVIAITGGTLAPPPAASEVRFIVSNLKTPAARQDRTVVSISTFSSSSSTTAIDSCSECAFVSELPLFVGTLSLSSTSPGAASVQMSIHMKNVWEPFVQGSTIQLAIPNVPYTSEAFPGDWQGPASGFKMSVNGDMCDASVLLSASGLRITYAGTSTYTSLDITINLGPYYVVPRKLSKPVLFTLTKSSNSFAPAAVTPVLYPEISGSCPAGHALNSTSKLCQRCYDFRYNDGSMSECQICPGQGLGDLSMKATKCVPFCNWPFEYMYDAYHVGTGCIQDGGLCSSMESATEDVQCPCSSVNYSPYRSGKAAYFSNCLFVNLNANIAVVSTVFAVFISIFIACVFKLPSKPGSDFMQRLRLKAKLMFLAVFPTLDFLSDMVYILTSKFHNLEIFLASVFFFVFPM
jgi:hypothetical protein